MEYESRVILKQFGHLWPAAVVVVTVLSLTSGSLIGVTDSTTIPMVFILFFNGSVRIIQLVMWLLGEWFSRTLYRIFSAVMWIVAASAPVIYVLPSIWTVSSRPVVLSVFVLCSTSLFIGEVWFLNEFPQYMRDMIVLQCADFVVAGDSVSFTPARKRHWALLELVRGLFRRRPIFLPGEDSLEIGGVHHTTFAQEESIVPRDIPAELTEAVLHHFLFGTDPSRLTNKPLWITADAGDRCSAIAEAVSSIISSSETGLALDVDVGATHSVFWPIVRALAIALPTYRDAIGAYDNLYDDSPAPFSEHLHCFPVPHSPSRPISPYYLNEDESLSVLDVIQNMISVPLADRNYLKRVRPGPARVVLVVHGVRDEDQARELYATIRELGQEKGNDDVSLVVISSPTLLRETIDDDEEVMRRICTLYASDTGVIYSGAVPTPPAFYETIFQLLMDGIHRVGGAEAERLLKKLPDFSSLGESDAPGAEDDPSRSTLSFFSMLHTAAEIRRKILQCLSEVKVVPWSQLNKALVEDNVKIAEMLQLLFEVRSYRRDLPALPKEHALAVLNLTHYILDGGLPERATIQNYDSFTRRAHLLLNRLSQYLGILPEEIAIDSVVLLSEHPIKHGGFSNIYHAIYLNPAGEQVEVALKVLKIFDDQSDEHRNVLHAKFAKEALVWHYLKHQNIVPFLGVDFTTFPSPTRAMVTPWMPFGSVLKYMGENSPSSPYALELLCGVIDGLNYLHSMNIVHGDICGRNILLDKNRQACLTDFGLAAFVDSDTSMKTSTRNGSTRWMAPELLLPAPGVHFKRMPASDIWAFGCVCCEIWSEGISPFSHISADAGVLLSFSAGDAVPYESIMHDTAGNPMPDRLWELVQWCWNHEPSERPDGEVIAEMLVEMKKAHPGKMNSGHQPVLSASGPAPPGPRKGKKRMHWHSSKNSKIETVASASGSGTSRAQEEEVHAPALTPAAGKGKKRVHFQEIATVRFGPVDIDGDPDEVFDTILDGLLNFVERELLVEPVMVEALDMNNLALRFHSPVEANTFAMTWMVYRFDPFEQVLAELMD